VWGGTKQAIPNTCKQARKPPFTCSVSQAKHSELIDWLGGRAPWDNILIRSRSCNFVCAKWWGTKNIELDLFGMVRKCLVQTYKYNIPAQHIATLLDSKKTWLIIAVISIHNLSSCEIKAWISSDLNCTTAVNIIAIINHVFTSFCSSSISSFICSQVCIVE